MYMYWGLWLLKYVCLNLLYTNMNRQICFFFLNSLTTIIELLYLSELVIILIIMLTLRRISLTETLFVLLC